MTEKQSFVDHILTTCGSQEKAIEAVQNDVPFQPVDARLNLQVLLNALGREEESFAVSNELMKLAPRDPRVLFNHGWHLLKRDQLQRGLSFLESGRALNTYGNPPIPSRAPLWTKESGRGQRVHLVLEGGLGDQMIHVRFGQMLAEKYDCRMTVICTPDLAPLLSHLPWVGAVLQREAAPGVYHQSWLPGMSAALALGLEYSDISGKPYLLADPQREKLWRTRLGEREGGGGGRKTLRIGIRWSGNPQFEHQQMRRFPPEILLRLRDLPGVSLYSFQRDNDLLALPEGVTDLAPQLKDWDDTAAALKQMDLVISSCTSVAHLSAALGLPTWVLVPALPYFVWAKPGKTSCWYDSVRLFRQSTFGSWADVEEELRVTVPFFRCGE